MEVTRVKFDRISPKKMGICADVTIFLDDSLVIHQVHVISGKKGLFVSFPNSGSMQLYEGNKRFYDIVHPCKDSLRVKITDAVLNAYEKQKNLE